MASARTHGKGYALQGCHYETPLDTSEAARIQARLVMPVSPQEHADFTQLYTEMLFSMKNAERLLMDACFEYGTTRSRAWTEALERAAALVVPVHADFADVVVSAENPVDRELLACARALVAQWESPQAPRINKHAFEYVPHLDSDAKYMSTNASVWEPQVARVLYACARALFAHDGDSQEFLLRAQVDLQEMVGLLARVVTPLSMGIRKAPSEEFVRTLRRALELTWITCVRAYVLSIGRATDAAWTAVRDETARSVAQDQLSPETMQRAYTWLLRANLSDAHRSALRDPLPLLSLDDASTSDQLLYCFTYAHSLLDMLDRTSLRTERVQHPSVYLSTYDARPTPLVGISDFTRAQGSRMAAPERMGACVPLTEFGLLLIAGARVLQPQGLSYDPRQAIQSMAGRAQPCAVQWRVACRDYLVALLNIIQTDPLTRDHKAQMVRREREQVNMAAVSSRLIPQVELMVAALVRSGKFDVVRTYRLERHNLPGLVHGSGNDARFLFEDVDQQGTYEAHQRMRLDTQQEDALGRFAPDSSASLLSQQRAFDQLDHAMYTDAPRRVALPKLECMSARQEKYHTLVEAQSSAVQGRDGLYALCQEYFASLAMFCMSLMDSMSIVFPEEGALTLAQKLAALQYDPLSYPMQAAIARSLGLSSVGGALVLPDRKRGKQSAMSQALASMQNARDRLARFLAEYGAVRPSR